MLKVDFQGVGEGGADSSGLQKGSVIGFSQGIVELGGRGEENFSSSAILLLLAEEVAKLFGVACTSYAPHLWYA